MDIERRVPWREVEPLPDLNGTIEPLLKTVSILRDAWEDALCGASPEDVLAVRERRLRHHAIETGIIERLSVTTIRRLQTETLQVLQPWSGRPGPRALKQAVLTSPR